MLRAEDKLVKLPAGRTRFGGQHGNGEEGWGQGCPFMCCVNNSEVGRPMQHRGRLGGKKGLDRESVLLGYGHSAWARERGWRLVPIGPHCGLGSGICPRATHSRTTGSPSL